MTTFKELDPEVVTLRGGLVVAVDAIALAIDLEFRGHLISVTDDGKLRISGRSRLTASDIRAVEAHRDDLIEIAKYEVPLV